MSTCDEPTESFRRPFSVRAVQVAERWQGLNRAAHRLGGSPFMHLELGHVETNDTFTPISIKS